MRLTVLRAKSASWRPWPSCQPCAWKSLCFRLPGRESRRQPITAASIIAPRPRPHRRRQGLSPPCVPPSSSLFFFLLLSFPTMTKLPYQDSFSFLNQKLAIFIQTNFPKNQTQNSREKLKFFNVSQKRFFIFHFKIDEDDASVSNPPPHTIKSTFNLQRERERERDLKTLTRMLPLSSKKKKRVVDAVLVKVQCYGQNYWHWV